MVKRVALEHAKETEKEHADAHAHSTSGSEKFRRVCKTG